jgi:hypothetical protein
LNKKFGLYINRPFVLQSRLPTHRVLEHRGANLYIYTHVRSRASQVFFFDQISKTIKAQSNKRVSIHIQSNGAASQAQVTTTTSRWW